MVFFGQFYGYMLAVGWGAFTDVNGDIQDCAFDTTHQFALSEWWALEMQASHHAIRGFTLIVLDEGYFSYLLIELPLGEGFEEVATSIFEYAGLDYQDAIDGGFDNVHTKILFYHALLSRLRTTKAQKFSS